MDDETKQALLKRHKELLKKHNAWQMRKGRINMHCTHPLADIKPREQFLIALDKVAPDVRETLDELAPLYVQARKTLGENYVGPNELGDWGELRYVATCVEHHNDTDAERFIDLYSKLSAWADRWSLGESHWRGNASWLLDHAVAYLEHAPQKTLFSWLDNGYKEHLTRQEKRLVLVEDVGEYNLELGMRDAYVESTLEKWKQALECHLQQMEQRLDEIHGGPMPKRRAVHFDWLVLRHIKGHSAETISTPYRPKISAEAVRAAINEAAELCGLSLQPLKTGRGDSEEKREAVDDTARRLKLPNSPS